MRVADMSPAHVLEPTYDAIRRRLIAGLWHPGQRLEAARIADDLGVSITPVRDSLNRLTGERLVHALSGDGFSVPRLTEADLRDLIDWHRLIVVMALDRLTADELPRPPSGHDGVADWTALLFATITSTFGSTEVNAASASAAARLGAYRDAEMGPFPDVLTELQHLEDGLNEADMARTRTGIEFYHRRRRDAASLLVEALR